MVGMVLMPEVVALGESLVQFNAVTDGPLRHVTYFEKHATGSEANVCVALVRLGVSCGLITRLGTDEFGLFIYDWLRGGEGVDVGHIRFDPESLRAFTLCRGITQYLVLVMCFITGGVPRPRH
ncbi:PfkB family carbohydrate kinase [Vulcanisaeta souniana]|uniref:PfkB family carbohydrate kinase n=1 Tax=Vulcanisaeta souniana TaxID=164452 RepID=UPI000B007000|nr:PfkB family carbohydrate kinase [Vulcanisaeta souniana]